MSFRTTGGAQYGGSAVSPGQSSAGGDDDDSFSVIDRYSYFDGSFRADRDLRIDGEVKGTIDCHGTLFVAPGATVSAKVDAENITVAGDLSGEIACRGRLQLLPTGTLQGRVSTAALVVNEGARYEGQLTMATREQPSSRATAPPTVRRAPVAAPEEQPRQVAAVAEPVPSTELREAAPSTFIRRLGGSEQPWDGVSENEEALAADPDSPR